MGPIREPREGRTQAQGSIRIEQSGCHCATSERPGFSTKNERVARAFGLIGREVSAIGCREKVILFPPLFP